MKIKTHYVALILFTLLTLGSGCASLKSGNLTLKQTRNDADWEMVRFHNRVTYGFITPQEQERVTTAYKAYQSAFNAAFKEAQGNYNAPTPDNVEQLANRLAEALASIP